MPLPHPTPIAYLTSVPQHRQPLRQTGFPSRRGRLCPSVKMTWRKMRRGAYRCHKSSRLTRRWAAVELRVLGARRLWPLCSEPFARGTNERLGCTVLHYLTSNRETLVTIARLTMQKNLSSRSFSTTSTLHIQRGPRRPLDHVTLATASAAPMLPSGAAPRKESSTQRVLSIRIGIMWLR